MIRFGYSEILISVKELVELSNGTLKSATIYSSFSRADKSPKSWIYKQDSSNKESALIYYSTIPKQSKDKHNLPDISVLIDRIYIEEAEQEKEAEQQKKDLLYHEMETVLQEAADKGFVRFCQQYGKALPGKNDKIIALAKAHSVLQGCMYLRATKEYTIAEIHKGYMQVKGIKQTLKNAEKFRSKLAEWEKLGINLVHAYAGRPHENLIKMTDWHKAKIEFYYSHPNQYGNRMVSELLTAECKLHGKTVISMASVAKYVAKPEVKNRLLVERNKALYKKMVQPSMRRLKPNYAADLYYADGSPLQIHCWNEAHTKVVRLNLFVVMDVNSGKIVGFDMAEREDRYTWIAAFKMAFSTQQLVPYELMYDNASATKTPEFETLKSELLLKGCLLNATTKGEPKQKANIERWFNTFQSGFQRMIEGFVGEGIRTKNDNGRIDVEYLLHLQKEKGHYTSKKIIEITANLITIYNSKATRNRKSPNKLFEASERPNASAIGAADLAMLFWKHKPLKVSNSEVKMTVRHNEYYYTVYDHTIGLKLDGTQVKVYYDENDLSTVHLFSLTGNYICECRQKVGAHQAKANQTEADVMQIIKQSKHNDAKKTVAKRLNAEALAAGIAGNEETFLQSFNPYEAALKDAANDAETAVMLNYIQHEKGFQFTGDYEPERREIRPLHERNKPTLEERNAKKFIKPATLEVIKRNY